MWFPVSLPSGHVLKSPKEASRRPFNAVKHLLYFSFGLRAVHPIYQAEFSHTIEKAQSWSFGHDPNSMSIRQDFDSKLRAARFMSALSTPKKKKNWDSTGKIVGHTPNISIYCLIHSPITCEQDTKNFFTWDEQISSTLYYLLLVK